MKFAVWKESRQKLGSPLLARLALATSLILIGMVLVLAWSRDSDNAAVSDRDRDHLSAAIDKSVYRLTVRVGEFADALLVRHAPLTTNFREATAGMQFFLLDLSREPRPLAHEGFAAPDGFTPFAPALSSALASARQAALEARAMTLRGALPSHEHKSLANVQLLDARALHAVAPIGDRVHIYAVLPLLAQDSGLERAPYAVVGVKPVDHAFLARVAIEAETGLVTITAQPAEGAGSTFAYPHAASAVFVNWIADRPGDRYMNRVGTLIISFAALFAGLIAYHTTRMLADKERQMAELASVDPLSGLPNRRAFTRLLDNALQSIDRGSEVALFWIDLDRFKDVNDSFGHEAGDKLIVAVSRRLQTLLGPSDRLARFGGDEFGMLCIGAKNDRDHEAMASKIIAALSDPFEISGRQAFVGASVGVALAPRHARERLELMRLADIALYCAKNDGRNRTVFYEERLAIELERRKTIEVALRAAIDHDALEVYYQPIVTGPDHRITAVEALVRWPQQDGGMIAPDVFIPMAEERGLINEIGEFVLRRACEDARHWPSHVRVAVNVSPNQFRHKGFVASVCRVLAETQFDPARLELELTENIVVADADQADAAIMELRAMGVRFAVDDFGTGYSSLIYLRRFAFDKIKIDRSFIDALENSNEAEEIVKSIIQLGCRLGLTVTAEGVETCEQMAVLETLGCHELQGYLFARPMPKLRVLAMMGQPLTPAALAPLAGAA